MLDHGYRIPQRRVLYTNSSRTEGYEAAHALLTSGDIPHAIICENNTLALGVIKAIQELALRIPEDIAVLTFDVYPYSSIIDPKLTVVDINVYDMGVQAGSMMLRKLENPTLLLQSYTTLPVVIQGESTKPLS